MSKRETSEEQAHCEVVVGITKRDLLYKDEYSWSTCGDDDPNVTGSPDNAELNRHEGYEVLHFINKFMHDNSGMVVMTGQKIERMIRNGLPKDIRSHKKVSQWVLAHWDEYY